MVTVIRGSTRAGPFPHLRRKYNQAVMLDQGAKMTRLVAAGHSIRSAAESLGLSSTTGWRRYHLVMDWTLSDRYGQPRGPIPPQRSTAACPRGRPWIPAVDDPAARRPRRPRRARIAGVDVGPVSSYGSVLWSTSAIGRRLGVSRERARQLTHRDDFPEPDAMEGNTRLWADLDVEEWILEYRPWQGDIEALDGPQLIRSPWAPGRKPPPIGPPPDPRQVFRAADAILARVRQSLR